ncbi:MAG: carbon starvation protein A [Acidiferrobacterales bacterium]
MNSLFLLATAAVVLILGYRFYSKLLALWVFRLDVNYSTPAHSRADQREFVPTNRHIVFGHHFAIVAGATTLIGTAIAVIWGWIPAFLWVLVGTAVAAGIFGLGTLWLGVRHGGAEPTVIMRELCGARAQALFLALAFVLLLLLNSILVWLAADVLRTYPAAVLPFWAQMLVALGVGVFLRQRGDGQFVLATLVSLVITLLALWLLGKLLFAFSGALNIDIRGRSLLSFDATIVWIVLLLVSAYYATRLPVWKLMQPRGYLVAVHTVILLIILFVGAIALDPPMVAPAFHMPVEGSGVIPWIFVTLTSGAIAGFYLLFAASITAKQLPQETDARYVGYGVAVAEAVLALSVILVCVAGFTSEQKWSAFYGSWEGVRNLPELLGLYVTGFVQFARALGIGTVLAGTFAAFVLASLIAVTLDAGIRVQKKLLVEFAHRYAVPRLADERMALLASVGLVAVLALSDGHGQGGLALWPLFGFWNQILAAAGLALITLALYRLQRPVLYVTTPMTILLVLAAWALLWQLLRWWLSANWLLFVIGTALLIIAIWLAIEMFRAFKQTTPAVPDA